MTGGKAAWESPGASVGARLDDTRSLATAREDRRDHAEGAERRDLGGGARRRRTEHAGTREGFEPRESFHAAAVIGGERSWISAAVSSGRPPWGHHTWGSAKGHVRH